MTLCSSPTTASDIYPVRDDSRDTAVIVVYITAGTHADTTNWPRDAAPQAFADLEPKRPIPNRNIEPPRDAPAIPDDRIRKRREPPVEHKRLIHEHYSGFL